MNPYYLPGKSYLAFSAGVARGRREHCLILARTYTAQGARAALVRQAFRYHRQMQRLLRAAAES